MLNLEVLSKDSSLMQMNITESRKFLVFAKVLHDLMSLVYPVSCRNGNVTLEICYKIPVKYAFCRKRSSSPMESSESFSIIVKLIRVSVFILKITF